MIASAALATYSLLAHSINARVGISVRSIRVQGSSNVQRGRFAAGSVMIVLVLGCNFRSVGRKCEAQQSTGTRDLNWGKAPQPLSVLEYRNVLGVCTWAYGTTVTCAGHTSKTPSLMGKLFVQVYVTPGTTDSKRIEVEGTPHHEGSESSFCVPIF